MKVGTICYATSRGLGHLARDFYRHGLITDVMVMRHGSIPTNDDWYPDAPSTDINMRKMDVGAMERFCEGMEAMIFFETPFLWSLFHHCRKKGIKTFLVTMYECTPKFHPRPDVYLCPSVLDLDYFEHPEHNRRTRLPYEVVEGIQDAKAAWVHLPVEYEWRQRHTACHFIHNGGYLGVRARGGVQREGTTTLIEAMQFVRSPLQLTIRVQENVSEQHQRMCARDSRITYSPNAVPYDQLYRTGDVAVGAQRWNGCSLPLQEAYAAGMLVMNTDRYPMHTWLPIEPLVAPCATIRGSSIGGAYQSFEEAVIDPRDLAAKMDEWYGRPISDYSLRGMQWAREMSWKEQLPKWRTLIESVCGDRKETR